MPGRNEINNEIRQLRSEGPHDIVRRKYLRKLNNITERNVIAYYSGFLQKPTINETSICDDDINGLMNVMHGLDKEKGLDILLHTEGGNTAATEAIVGYLRCVFGNDVRAIVPQMAMSAGTMIACSCKEIIMGKQSSLGPIDPQFGGMSGYGLIEVFEKALQDAVDRPNTIPIWNHILSGYHPTLVGDCKKAIEWSGNMLINWLENGMFKDSENSKEKAENVANILNNNEVTKNHARHIGIGEAQSIGLKIIPLEEIQKDEGFQDIVLSAHHAYMATFADTYAYKIIENHNGRALIYNNITEEDEEDSVLSSVDSI